MPRYGGGGITSTVISLFMILSSYNKGYVARKLYLVDLSAQLFKRDLNWVYKL